MAKQIIRALVALLATSVLVGCGSMQPMWSSKTTTTVKRTETSAPAPAPVAPQGAIEAKPALQEQVVGQFPTSSKPAQGKPWTTMHAQGFTGNYGEASKLLGLSTAQAKKYEEMHSAGSCQVVDVPNGVVLDRLTFTRGGKHHIDHGAKVALVNPSSRKTEVCDLGGGVVAMRFHGCNNHAVVVGWKPGKATVAPPASAPAPANACYATQKIRLVIWEAKAAEVSGVKETIAKAGGSSYYDSGDISRGFGRAFRAEKSAGRLGLGKKSTLVTISLMKANGTEEKLFSGPVVGSHTFTMPLGFVEGDDLRVLFAGPMTSPTSSQFGPEIRARRNEFQFAKCESEVHLNAIEK